MTPNFEHALAEHGSAKEAITAALWLEWYQYNGDAKDSFDAVVAPWILANAASIAAHQSGTQNDMSSQLLARIQAVERASEDRDRLLSIRLQDLEDAPGPRADADEVSALRQRMDGLAETLEKIQPLDTSDVLERLVRDVALLKDSIVLTYTPDGYEKARQFRNTYIGTEPQTPEACKLLGVDVATPEPEPVYEWVGNEYYFDGKAVGGISQIYNGRFSSICEGENFPRYDNTEAEARAWVEAQFNTPKQ